MFLTYRIKLAPTRGQYAVLAGLCEAQRQLYNAALQERRDAWAKRKVSISRFDQCKSLTQIRSFDPDYGDVPVNLSRWTLGRVDDAMKGFFGRVKRGQKAGFPRFRSGSRWDCFGFAEWAGVRLDRNKLLFKPLPGGLRLRLHRELPPDAAVKTAAFSRKGRHWYVCLVVDVPAAATHARPETAVGLDVGIEHLVTTSEGRHIENVRPRSRRERDLRIAQRALARCKRGSRRRAKIRERLARLQRAVANVRSNHLHQVSADLARRYALIGVEELRLKNLTRSARGTAAEPGKNVRQKAGLNRAMLDASPARLIELLTYKAARAGGMVVKIDPRNTSRDCSSCGVAVEKTLAERRHRCGCGADLHRDHNAALNILDRALRHDGRGKPPGDANVGPQPVRRPGNTDVEAAEAA
ncbi:putative transposase [Bradyrhizobium sp. USDA 4341]